MEFRILGPLEVTDEGRTVPIERRLSRAVLAYLLLHANQPVSRDRLVDQLWGENAPRNAPASLQNTISRLRKAIGRERLRLEPGGYVLRVDPERFDLAQFDRLVEEARTATSKDRASLLQAALALRRGEPLEDLAFEEFAQSEIAHLQERLLAAVEARIDAELALGAGPEVVEELEGLVEAHPLREGLRGQLMIALYRAGRQADALAVYQAARAVLDDELGLEPGEELRGLQRRVLNQDETLLGTAAPAAPAQSRRTVSVLFCDVVGSTELATELDPEAYRELMGSYYEVAGTAIRAHGGLVEKFIGDAVLGVFGVPELHEDDALRAVRAAVDVRAGVSLVQGVRALRVRIAVNTGEVVTPGFDQAVHVAGAPVNVAAHLEQRAAPDEILLGVETVRLVGTSVRAEELVFEDGLRAARLDELLAPAGAGRAPSPAPLVGRRAELRKLRSALQRARREERCRVVSVVGEPGIGKTRLALALTESVGDARAVFGRCAPYGGATYAPIAEILRQLAPGGDLAALAVGVDDGPVVARRAAEAVGLAEGAAAPGEAFWAVRRLFEAVAAREPLVVVLDDVQWAEPTLLDLVEYLASWAEAPILLVCLARPDLLAARPGWSRASGAVVIELGALPAEQVGSLLDDASEGGLAPDLRTQIVQRAGGNPLFAEQLLAFAAEGPAAPLDQAPPTVEALIAARLDQLESGELGLLRCASVLGRRFKLDELHALGAFEHADLAALTRKGLVHPPEAETAYTFHHVLVRDAAYRSIPKAKRAELHEQAADHLDRRDGPDELIGHHLEQAHRCRVELGHGGDKTRRLARAGGESLGRAGTRAWKQADVPAASNLIGRSVTLLPADDERRAELLCELGLAGRMRGDLAAATEQLADAVEASRRIGSRRVELRASIELAHIRALRDPRESRALLELAREAIPELEAAGDERALGRAWYLVSFVEGSFECRFAVQEEAAARAAEHYERAGWSPSVCLGCIGAALVSGPRHVSDGLARSSQLLERHAGDRASEANILLWDGLLRGMAGEVDAGRERIEQALETWRELGQVQAAEVCRGEGLGALEHLAGRHDQAEAALRGSCDACTRLGESALLASRAADLADVLCDQGRHDEAETWVETARANAAETDLDAQVRWRRAAAKVYADRGDARAGETLAREALASLEPTDAVNERGLVLVALAETLQAAGRGEEAAASLSGAERLFEAKGNRLAAARASAALAATALV